MNTVVRFLSEKQDDNINNMDKNSVIFTINIFDNTLNTQSQIRVIEWE